MSGDWKSKRVLVTGATGFLGGWLVKELCAKGADVTCIVHRPKPLCQFYLEKLDGKTRVEIGSVYDWSFLERLVSASAFDVLFHTAYGADVNRVLREPLECFRSSVESTWYLLELLRLKQPQCVAVISSSDKAYGTQELPYRETQKLNPLHPYEVAKASQDWAAQTYGKIYGLPVAISRCGNYFGGYDLNFTRLIPSTIRKIRKQEAPVLRSDGKATRDFLYIADAVAVQLLLAEKLARDPSLRGEAFNFSYDRPFEAIEVVQKLLALSGSDLQPIIEATAKSEIPHMHLSSDKAVSLLGWKAEYGFEEGLKKTWDWYQSSPILS